MTTRHEDRAAAVQPELPLGSSARRPAPGTGRSEVAPSPRRTSLRSGAEDGGRLDERTRAIGRRGIAAARARLEATSTAAPASKDTDMAVVGDDRRSPERRGMAGRAA